MKFKDLFSKQAQDYARFRPVYPDALYEYLASLTEEHDLAWDCGTGNGQAAVQLAKFFSQVVGTDPSASQLKNAVPHPRVQYRVGSAEEAGFDNSCVNLITAAQAFHWFNQPIFFQEVKRVLKPKGVLAFWAYGLAKISPGIDHVIDHLYSDILGKYWEPERLMVENGYSEVVLPMEEIKTNRVFHMETSWSIEHLLGYLGTWSALQTYIKTNGENPLQAVFEELQSVWPQGEGAVLVKWDLALRVGRNSSMTSQFG